MIALGCLAMIRPHHKGNCSDEVAEKNKGETSGCMIPAVCRSDLLIVYDRHYTSISTAHKSEPYVSSRSPSYDRSSEISQYSHTPT